MSAFRGRCVVAWFERWGDRFLRVPQPGIYQLLLLHVGGTDILRHYSGTAAYWQYVQAILDCFFSAAERAEMCEELINEPLLLEDPGSYAFLTQARAEIRCRELISAIEGTAGIRTSLRSVS